MTKGLYSYPKIEKRILNEPPKLTAATIQRRALKTADFNMGTLDFLRYHELLKELNRVELFVLTGREEMMQPFYAILNVLYGEWRDDANPQKQIWMDQALQEAEKLIFQTTKDDTEDMESFEINSSLRPLLMKIKRELFTLRKDVGISYPRSAMITARQKLKKALSV